MLEVEKEADKMSWEEVKSIRGERTATSEEMAIASLKVFKEKVRLLESIKKLESKYDELSRI